MGSPARRVRVNAPTLCTRQMLEQAEAKRLAPHAVTSATSAGRLHEESEHAFRTCFQRDRDSVVHSSAFRRLDAKTQVFVSFSGDYYRTRLTHTLEVAQIARTLARGLSLNEDLAEVVALAHDLGHPPYGHCGEYMLDELMADQGGFEHNAHALRIVEYLEHPYPAFRGLNLTLETLECLAKHESRYDHPRLNERFGAGPGPLEGQIADLADAIAYNSHDLDDALAYGLIDETDLDSLELYRTVQARFQEDYPSASDYIRRIRCTKMLIDELVTDALHYTMSQLADLPAATTEYRSFTKKIVGLSRRRQAQLDELADFLMQRVYLHEQVVTTQQEARRQIQALFEFYLNKSDALPQRYSRRIDEQGPHRVACDYIAGMTDRFCLQTYESIC